MTIEFQENVEEQRAVIDDLSCGTLDSLAEYIRTHLAIPEWIAAKLLSMIEADPRVTRRKLVIANNPGSTRPRDPVLERRQRAQNLRMAKYAIQKGARRPGQYEAAMTLTAKAFKMGLSTVKRRLTAELLDRVHRMQGGS